MEIQTTPGFAPNACLRGTVRGRVRDLPGYAKPRTPLTSHSDWEQSFVEATGTASVSELATDLFEKLRDAFHYKRKELVVTKASSRASLQCPDFEVHIALTQDPEDAERYVRTIDVRAFRNPAILEDPRFAEIFTGLCHQVVFDLHSPLDIEKAIDDIEEVETLRKSLEYDPECTWFTITVARIVLRGTPGQLTFTLSEMGGLDRLLFHTRSVIEQLHRDSIKLGVVS